MKNFYSHIYKYLVIASGLAWCSFVPPAPFNNITHNKTQSSFLYFTGIGSEFQELCLEILCDNVLFYVRSPTSTIIMIIILSRAYFISVRVDVTKRWYTTPAL